MLISVDGLIEPLDNKNFKYSFIDHNASITESKKLIKFEYIDEENFLPSHNKKFRLIAQDRHI